MSDNRQPADVIPLHVARPPSRPCLATDLLEGASAIAEFVFGDRAAARRVYRLRDKGRLPVIRVGGRLVARRSALRQWFIERERDAARGR